MKIAQIQKRLFSVMKKLKNICEEHNIKYFLAYGTLLGAVRHKGFIPWDDDIDIVMPRNDYEKFITIMEKEKNELCLYIYGSTKDYYLPFIKVGDMETRLIQKGLRIKGPELSVSIDVFPLDGLSSDFIKAKIQLKKAKFYKRLIYVLVLENPYSFHSLPQNIIKTLFVLPCKAIGLKRILNWVNKNAKHFKYNDSIFISNLGWDTNYISIPKKYFDTTIQLEFEGEMFPCPKEYDLLLRMVYGNYMELPPESSQVSNHEFEAWIL